LRHQTRFFQPPLGSESPSRLPIFLMD